MKNLKLKTLNLPFVAILLLSTLTISSCGKNPQNQIIKDIVLESTFQDDDVWVSVKALVKLGDLSMTAIDVPIQNPNSPGDFYGRVALTPTLQMGYNEVNLSLNLSEAARIQGSDRPTLPNGNNIPLAGGPDSVMIEIPIEQINSKVYFALDNDTTVLGFAVAIKEFDVLRDYIPGANVFLGFNIKEVLGSVGLFTSPDPGESGLGLFVDLSSVVSSDILNDLINGERSNVDSGTFALKSSSFESFAMMAADKSSKSGKSSGLKLQTKTLSNKQSYKIYKGFKRVSDRTKKLHYTH